MKYTPLLHGDINAWGAIDAPTQEAWMGAHAAADAEAHRGLSIASAINEDI